jgi:hypothetical protein
MGEVLAQANLRPTLLHELLNRLRQSGISLPGDFRKAADLLDVLTAGMKETAVDHLSV